MIMAVFKVIMMISLFSGLASCYYVDERQMNEQGLDTTKNDNAYSYNYHNYPTVESSSPILAPTSAPVTVTDSQKPTVGKSTNSVETPVYYSQPSPSPTKPPSLSPTSSPTNQATGAAPVQGNMSRIIHDPTAKLLGWLLILLGIGGTLCTAWQILEYPKGLCASCCRILLRILSCFIVFIIFRPCKLCLRKARGYSVASQDSGSSDELYMDHELRMT